MLCALKTHGKLQQSVEGFRARLLGCLEVTPPLYETIIRLNIRSGSGSVNKPLPGGPLPKGARLEKLKAEGSWMFVDVLD